MIVKSTFVVRLEAEDGAAELTFRRPKMNEVLLPDEDADGDKTLAARRHFERVLKHLVDVKGLFDEAGNAITADEIKSLGLDTQTILAIVAAFNAQAFPRPDEKNASSIGA